MMYVIQTNTNILINNTMGDFQSLMYKINQQTWEEFKEYILSEKSYAEKIVNGTMIGSAKPTNHKVISVLIDDDYHLEIVTSHGKDNQFVTNSKYYMVNDENFNRLIG